jgi:hypothetical protein
MGNCLDGKIHTTPDAARVISGRSIDRADLSGGVMPVFTFQRRQGRATTNNYFRLTSQFLQCLLGKIFSSSRRRRKGNDVVLCRRALCQPNDPRRCRFHDPFVFFGVIVPVINRGDAAFDMVRNSIHRGATEAKFGDFGAKRPAQIVGPHCFDSELGRDRAHDRVELGDRAPTGAGENEAGGGFVTNFV